MRPRTSAPGDSLGPRPTYSLRGTLAGTLLLSAAFAAVLLAASYPATTLGVGAVAVAGWLAVRALRSVHDRVRTRLRRRRETGRTRTVCLPAGGPCIEA